MTITMLNEGELRECARLDVATLDTIADAFAALHRGEAVMPPVLSMELPDQNAEADIKTAWMKGFDGFAVKVSPGFFDNPTHGLPSLSGMMTLLSAKTGFVQAILLDNGWLTDLRTAAAGGVAARCLARTDARTAAIIGTGVQARLQLEALTLVCPIERVIFWGRDAAKARRCADHAVERLGLSAAVSETAAEAVRRADVAVTTTPATEAIIGTDALHPGLHITAMGSDAPTKNEIDPAALAAADVLVCDRQSQCSERGELRSALAAGTIAADRVLPELGALVAGAQTGRDNAEQVTIADLTGTGIQDTAIANVAREAGEAAGFGVRVQE
jgi:ornithine cyclodeaminase